MVTFVIMPDVRCAGVGTVRFELPKSDEMDLGGGIAIDFDKEADLFKMSFEGADFDGWEQG